MPRERYCVFIPSRKNKVYHCCVPHAPLAGTYTMKAIAAYFGVHYSTVSRVVITLNIRVGHVNSLAAEVMLADAFVLCVYTPLLSCCKRLPIFFSAQQTAQQRETKRYLCVAHSVYGIASIGERGDDEDNVMASGAGTD